MKHRLLTAAAAGVALVLPLFVTAPTHAAPPSPSTVSEPSPTPSAAEQRRSQVTKYSRATRKHTNNARERHGLGRFDYNKCVDGFANRQAAKMARSGELVHQDLGRIMSRCNLNTAGENIAYGASTGRAVVRMWMNSAGHRANILNGDFRLLGVGAVRDAEGRVWAAQVFGRRS